MTDLNKLDREVAEVLGLNIVDKPTAFVWIQDSVGTRRFHPSTNLALAMALLKEHKLGVVWNDGGEGREWLANDGEHYLHGSTPEIAICKAVVAAKNAG